MSLVLLRSYGGAADGAATISVSSPPAPWRDLMEARTVSNLPTAAPHHDVVRCLLAIELSKASWIVAVHTPLSDKISRYTLEGCDWKSLLELIERIRKRVTRECKLLITLWRYLEAGVLPTDIALKKG